MLEMAVDQLGKLYTKLSLDETDQTRGEAACARSDSC
jgi:hypothetical protein